jgi:hypothetical protein
MATSSSVAEGKGINFICLVFCERKLMAMLRPRCCHMKSVAENELTTGYESSEVSSFLLYAIE